MMLLCITLSFTKCLYYCLLMNLAHVLTYLPPDKLSNLHTMVKEMAGARVICDKQALESLVGHFEHVGTVFRVVELSSKPSSRPSNL